MRPTLDALISLGSIDIIEPDLVEIRVTRQANGTVIYVDVGGVTLLRASRVKTLEIRGD